MDPILFFLLCGGATALGLTLTSRCFLRIHKAAYQQGYQAGYRKGELEGYNKALNAMGIETEQSWVIENPILDDEGKITVKDVDNICNKLLEG